MKKIDMATAAILSVGLLFGCGGDGGEPSPDEPAGSESAGGDITESEGGSTGGAGDYDGPRHDDVVNSDEGTGDGNGEAGNDGEGGEGGGDACQVDADCQPDFLCIEGVCSHGEDDGSDGSGSSSGDDGGDCECDPPTEADPGPNCEDPDLLQCEQLPGDQCQWTCRENDGADGQDDGGDHHGQECTRQDCIDTGEPEPDCRPPGESRCNGGQSNGNMICHWVCYQR